MLRKLLSAVAGLALILMPMTTPGAQEADVQKMPKEHATAYSATLALYGNKGDISHFLCTATVVAHRGTQPGGTLGRQGSQQYLLLTAGHCIVGPDLPADLNFFVRKDIVPDAGAEKQPGDIVADVARAEFSPAYDFAILVIQTDEEFPVIPTEVRIPDVEEKIYCVNFTEGLVKQVALGVVASEPIKNKDPEANDRYLVHLFGSHGASGSAIISEKTHKIVGIWEFGYDGETVGGGIESTVKLAEWLSTPAPQSKRLYLANPKESGPQNSAASWSGY